MFFTEVIHQVDDEMENEIVVVAVRDLHSIDEVHFPYVHVSIVLLGSFERNPHDVASKFSHTEKKQKRTD